MSDDAWEAVPPVAPRQRPRAGAAVRGGDDGVAARLHGWFDQGWEPQLPTLRRPGRHAGGVLARGGDDNSLPPFPAAPNPAALQILFDAIVSGANTTWCDFDLYTVTLFGGGALRFTTADFDIAWNNSTYASGGVRVDQKESKTQAHWKLGFDVDTWTVVFMPRPVDPVTGAAFPDVVGSVPWIEAAGGGAFDFADFQVDRAYFSTVPTWPMPPGGAVPLGTKTIFAGVVAEVDCTDLTVVFTVNDYRSLLSISMPRQFYQGACRHTLFDAGCNADGFMVRTAFARPGAVGAGSTQSNIVAAGLTSPGGSGTYALGTVVMTSGLNNTFSRTVASWDGLNLALVNPFPFLLIAGDTFTASPGCDLTRFSCAKFKNTNNFGGFPFIPAPETAA